MSGEMTKRGWMVALSEDELLALAVVKPSPGDLKPEYMAAHDSARQKFADAYVAIRTGHTAGTNDPSQASGGA